MLVLCSLPTTKTTQNSHTHTHKNQIQTLYSFISNGNRRHRVHKMGSEQSHPSNSTTSRSIHGRPNTATGASGSAARLQRGNTIAVTERRISTALDESRTTSTYPDSRPVSPPISVCSDSDLPYVSYTDKPIGGKYLRTDQCVMFFLSPLISFSFQTHRSYEIKHKIQFDTIEMQTLPQRNPF